MEHTNDVVNHGYSAALVLVVQFLPIVIAALRKHRQIGPISIISLASLGMLALIPLGVAPLAMGIIGMMVIGPASICWIVALAWSTSYQPPEEAKVRKRVERLDRASEPTL